MLILKFVLKFLRLISVTPLFEAIERNDIHAVRRLAIPSLLNKRENGTYPLKVAIQKGNYRIVKILLDAGAEVNPSLGKGEKPPLFLACQLEENFGHRKKAAVPIVKLLLDRGADSNLIDDNDDLFGYCVLIGAWKVGHLLLERPDVVVDVNRRMSGNSLLPLEVCSILGEFSLVRAMVEKGNANLSVVDDAGRTPLFLTARDMTGETAKAMLAKGANINYRTAAGLTALHYALEQGNEEVVGILLENGADPNASGPEILPPALYILNIIRREGGFYKLKCLKTLLKKADVNLAFGDGTIMDEILRRISSTRDDAILQYTQILTDLLEIGSLQPARLESFEIFASPAVSSCTFEEYFKKILRPLLVRTGKEYFFNISKISLTTAISLSELYFYADFCAVAMAFYEYSNQLRLPKVYERLLDTKLFEFYCEERREIFANSYFGKIPFKMVKSIWMDRMNPNVVRKCKRRSMTMRVIAIMGNHLGLGVRETNFNISDKHLRTFLKDLVQEIEPKLEDDSKNGADFQHKWNTEDRCVCDYCRNIR